MRKALAILGLLAIPAMTAAAPAPAQAGHDYLVCMRVFGDPTYDECNYTTLAQCAATASGRAAQCYVYPFARAAALPEGRKPYRRHGVY